MTKHTKMLCDLSKTDLEKHCDALQADFSSVRYLCRKCARVARTKAQVCKPRKLDRES